MSAQLVARQQLDPSAIPLLLALHLLSNSFRHHVTNTVAGVRLR